MNPAQAIEVVIVGADHPQRLALAEALQRDRPGRGACLGLAHIPEPRVEEQRRRGELPD